MSYIKKPNISHPGLPRNAIGLTLRDYEGSMSTLCAGCGHDSVSAAIIQSYFDLSIEPHRVAKISGIGCSSKTPTYFLGGAHGFNSVHGRMPSIATGANAANREMQYIGVSGDGDSLSIGLGQFGHAIRRNINMMYVIENNGVYGLTKGQFSASADVGSTAKKGDANPYQPIDPEGSTKSYEFMRENERATVYADFIPNHEEITASSEPGGLETITMHDGSRIRLRRVTEDYDPTDRAGAFAHVESCSRSGEIPTGLLYMNSDVAEMHDLAGTTEDSLASLDYGRLNPGSEALAKLQQRWR